MKGSRSKTHCIGRTSALRGAGAARPRANTGGTSGGSEGLRAPCPIFTLFWRNNTIISFRPFAIISMLEKAGGATYAHTKEKTSKER